MLDLVYGQVDRRENAFFDCANALLNFSAKFSGIVNSRFIFSWFRDQIPGRYYQHPATRNQRFRLAPEYAGGKAECPWHGLKH
jgi:hypothetical protein